MKKYITPTYAVVEIKNSDVIATSTLSSLDTNVGFIYGGGWNGYARSVERGFDEWYEGY